MMSLLNLGRRENEVLRLAWALIFLLAPALIASAQVAPEDFVGVWLLDEGRGDFVEDATGNGNDGIMTGADWTDGKFGNALHFDAAGEVKIESTERLNLGDEFTMMAYFYADATVDWHQIVAKDGEYLLRIDPPSEGTRMSAFVMLDGGWEPRASAFVPETETWYHFAATYSSDDGTLIVYVDGVKAGQSARVGKPAGNVNPVTFGHWGGGSRFQGIIDEVAILDVALEERDIADIAQQGLSEILGGGQSVQPVGKLTTSWANVKKN